MIDGNYVKGKDIQGNVRTFEKSQPYQLELFQYLLPDRERHSSTVELYDAVPRFHASPKKMAEMRQGGKYLGTLRREFRFRDSNYQVEIRPARITRKNGEDIEYYPSEREQLVEEALWKIAHDKMHGCYLDQMVSVGFSLYELRQELAKRGHAIHFHALIDSLSILNRCGITLRNESGTALFSSAVFPQMIITSRSEWLENPKKAKCYVQFNLLATESLKQLSYRLFDYAKFMTLQQMLAKWFFKRLSHNFIQAKTGTSYQIKASTIIRDSGLVERSSFRFQVQAINAALQELTEKRVVLQIQKKRVVDPMDKRRTADVIYDIMPTHEFSKQVILGNQRAQDLERQAQNSGKLSERIINQKLHIEILD